jgi:hypothetical protein
VSINQISRTTYHPALRLASDRCPKSVQFPVCRRRTVKAAGTADRPGVVEKAAVPAGAGAGADADAVGADAAGARAGARAGCAAVGAAVGAADVMVVGCEGRRDRGRSGCEAATAGAGCEAEAQRTGGSSHRAAGTSVGQDTRSG